MSFFVEPRTYRPPFWRTIPVRSPREWLERTLWIIGTVLLGGCAWSLLQAGIYQKFESWALDQRAAGQSASIGRFLESRVGLVKTSPPLPVAPLPAADEPSVRRGDLVGRLEIPRLGMSAIVLEGDDDRTLRLGVGHVPGTAFPGRRGNVALAAHRDTFFRPLRGIKPADRIAVTTTRGTYRYAVDFVRIVSPDDVAVLADTARPSLTLVTCYPFYWVGNAPKRFVVRASRIDPS